MWDGVHTIIFVVATFAAGRPNHRTSKMCVILISELVLLCRGGGGATDVQCHCNGN